MSKKWSGADMRCEVCNKYLPDRCTCNGPSIEQRRTPAEPAPASTGRERDLLCKLRVLVYAASAVIERWDSPKWKDEPHTAEFINRLRIATNEASSNSVAARELDVEAERRGFQTRMGPQGDDPIPAWWYHLHAAAEALADHGCEANAADVRDIANNLLDQAAPVSTEQAGDAVIEAARKLIKAKGRYHTEQSYKALMAEVQAYNALGDAVQKMDSPNNSPAGADKEP